MDFKCSSTGSKNTSTASQTRETDEMKKDLFAGEIVGNKFLCKPPKSYVRKPGTIPFHIPHKKLLEKIEYKKELPEPLTGLNESQQRLLRRRRAETIETAEEDKQSETPKKQRKTGVHFIEQGETVSKAETQSVTILPHHKLKDVVNQKELINRMRQTTDGAFVYMAYAVPRSSEMYTPYALKLVPYEKIEKSNFLTMSFHGVTQHISGEMVFTHLDKWEAEYDMYCRLMRIKTFFHFRLWKGFYTWKKIVRYHKIKMAKRYLEGNLFILNENLGEALLNIRNMCYMMSDVTFTDLKEIQNFYLFYFIEAQMRKLEIVAKKMKEFVTILREIINNGCHGALLSKGFVVDETIQEGKKGRGRAPKLSYIEQAKKKKFCMRLTAFIILVDYLTINTLHQMVTNSLGQLLNVLNTHRKFTPSPEILLSTEINTTLEPERPKDEPQLPLIIVTVTISADSLNLDPPQTIMEYIFRQVIHLWKEKVLSVKLFIQDDLYKPFTNPMINGKMEERLCGYGPPLSFYLRMDKGLASLKDQIFECISASYESAFMYVKRFEVIRQFYAEDLATNRERIEEERNLEVIRGMCVRYQEEQKIIDSIVNEQPLGLFFLQQEQFKQTVLPQPKRLFEILESVLPRIGKDKVDKLIEEVNNDTHFLTTQQPKTTDEYVKYLEFVEIAPEKADGMEAELDYCKELYDIMEEFHITVSPDDMSNYLGLSVSMGTLRGLVDRKTDEKQKILKQFADQMNKDISALISEVGAIKDQCLQPWLYDIESNIDEVQAFLNGLYEHLQECQNKAADFRNYQKQFRMEVTRFDMLDDVMNDLKLRMLLWESVDTWAKTVAEWYEVEFSTLNVDNMNAITAKYMKNVAQLEKGLPKNLIVPKLKEDVERMKDKLPVISYLRNPTLKQRHWLKIEGIIHHKFKSDEVVTLKRLEGLRVFDHPDELMEVSAQASGEAGLEVLLKKIEDSWKSLEFNVMPHKDAKDVFILGSTEDIQTVLDESNINMTTIASSRYVGPIKPRVDEWLKFLDHFSKVLDEWLMCQQSWVYLEVIFSAPDIQRQLPNEAKMFATVDKSWKEIMRRTAKMPLAMEAANYPGILETLQKNNALLEQIMKCLEYYLELKRVAFPRFYFLSNDELLDILAQVRNPHAVQPHLRKCFDAIAKLEFGIKDQGEGEAKTDTPVLTNDIIAMISPEGERVALGKGLKARGNVEDWLKRVEESMFITIYRLLKHGLADFQTKKREEWVLLHPNQIVLTVSQTMWCRGVHKILDQSKNLDVDFPAYETKCIQVQTYIWKVMPVLLHSACVPRTLVIVFHHEYTFDGWPFELWPPDLENSVHTEADLNNLAGLVRLDLHPVTRKVLIALITIDVHARDTITSMIKNKVNNSQDFEWLKMLRYYWQDDIDNCLAKMSNSVYVYGCEYLGAAGVLVITPLTDRCYLCLMSALQLDLGGAPAGPAGTGKTETTKDLSKAVAIQCVVFNCSEGLDYKIMGRFFSGLAQSGAWSCFDEFNRIDIEVLSVIAQQIITIRNAKAAKLKRFMFEGREIKLVPSCATFITMNPGYAGRTELPDNLKALFRPIAMMVPDYALIAEVTLYSEGFESSKVLAHKMVQMYKLCSEQLSLQDHYDFGMRAVKSVLVMAGSLKRASPDRNEDVVLISALRDSNLPKFLADDAILFQGILGDLFPGVDIPVPDYGVFEEAIKECMTSHKLQAVPSMIVKVIQLYETMIVRWGVMLVGPTGGGKSSVLNTLKYSLAKMYDDGYKSPYFQPVHTYIINPKAVTAGELYGEVNPFTLEWRDGLMGIMVRTAVQSTNEDHQWVICDGPVDAVWIENLNTVLDDNKMLCLANSERIKLTPYVHMVFEVMDLAQASPATVSRCGMVYIDPEDLKWFPYVQSWMDRIDESILTQDLKDFMLSLFEYAVEKGLTYVKKKCSYAIHQVDVSKATMVCKIIESIITVPGAMYNVGEKRRVRNFLCQTFIFAYVWGVGGNLDADSRELFESVARDQFDEHQDARLPPGGDLWSLYINIQSHKLEPWARIIPHFTYDKETPFFDMLVPTIDTIRFGYIMEKLVNVNYPVLYTGDTGVGKSVIAKQVLNTLQESGLFVPASLNFSAQTSSARTQEILELKLERKKKTLLGAPAGKRIVLFVDDVNMPKLETYGAQPPIELLRMFLDYGGLYDRNKLFWKHIRDLIITAACAPPGGGRNPLTPRFVRHFGMLLIPAPDEYTLKGIFKAILKGFLTDFANPVKDLGDNIVSAAVEIYNRISVDLLPTPAKSHYVFNLRDLSKCIQGVLQADPGSVREAASMLRLFYHECLRTFHDRLINIEDRSYFYLLMKELCNRIFGNPVLQLPDDVTIIENPPILLFGDFSRFGVDKADRIYEEFVNIDKLRRVLQEYLDDYNLGTSKEMKLIFFMDAIEHCCRIARILRAERGNGLLVGVGGMGKQSLTRLASHVNTYKCYQIELARNYDHSSFFDDLRKMYFSAGGKKEIMVFLFTDTQIVQEEFLEDINNILNTGEVPNLFEAEELEKAIIACRPDAKEAGVNEESRDAVYDFFIQRVRRNLHLVICMSPVGDAFRRRCRMFPSLVNCCTIDWFSKWPQEALRSVAIDTLEDIIEDDQMTSNLASICMFIHESVEDMTDRFYIEMRRHYYTTPSSYLDLLSLYIKMLDAQKTKITKMRDRVGNGLQKIHETNTLIDQMKEELTEMEPLLVKQSAAVEKLMEHLTVEQERVDKVRKVVQADEAAAQEKAAATQALADDAQQDLAVAMPALEAAVNALQSLNKNDINELKVFQKPPELVRVVMEAVCLLLGAKPDWNSAKQVMADVNFLKRLQDYDKDHIPESTLKKLKTYVDNKHFVPEEVAKVSKVCKSMCLWVRAIDQYAKVFKIVQPKRKRLAEAEAELGQVMAVLRDKQKKLADVEAMIANLRARFKASVDEKKALEDNIALTGARLVRAGRLNIALGDEQVRWEQSVQESEKALSCVVGDVLLAAASVAYLGAFTSYYRKLLVDMWFKNCKTLKIPSADTFSLIAVLADAYEIRAWNAAGLPRDDVSTENAILVTKGSRWPLMIDPQEQANRWVRQMETPNDLKIIKLTDPNFMRYLEIAVRFGNPVLLEEVEETLDPTLTPILLKQVFHSGGRLLIHLGDSDVEYDPNFKFYITTKMANPHYLPEICIQVTIVNFTVTPSGLEDQLLADVVRLERPDLEEQRTELIVRINSDKAQLSGIEDQILRLLFTSEGNILDNEELIDTLNESKETSAVIAARLTETEATEKKISVAREKYRPVATRGSVLYFVVAVLVEIDPMYQYSLKYFTQVFSTVIETSEKSNVLSERLEILFRDITMAIYTNVSRGLFERHKLVFSFMLCTSIFIQSGAILESQFNYLIRGPVGAKQPAKAKPNFPTITDAMWVGVNYLADTFTYFAPLVDDITNIITVTVGDFQQEIKVVPKATASSKINWDKQVKDFDKLLILKTLQEEKLVFAITQFVKLKLGQQFIESPQISLNLIYQDTSNITPLIFVLSSGSDPFSAFQRFAAEMGFLDRIQSISLGQGQGPVAEKMIQSAKSIGDWVFLQNCHLATSWMLSMEKIIIQIAEDPSQVHKDFRIFMSSMPSKAFPVSVLQNSVKVTNEPPKGIRANIKRAFTDMTEDFFENNPLGQDWRSMLFGLCMFHAIIQERKKFGPLGWNIIYEFNDSDREFAFNTLKMFCAEGTIPWDALEYMTGEITYGGRVTDYWDLRCLKTILMGFFSPQTLAPNYAYSKSGVYYCPQLEKLAEYIDFIDKLPIIEGPEIFGMHENANIAYQTKETQSILKTIMACQPSSSGGTEGKSSDEIVYELAEEIKGNIMTKINPDLIHPSMLKRDDKGRVASLTTVLMQEVDRFNKLLNLIHNSLDNLQKAIKGFVVMSEALEEVFRAFINNMVPQMWSSKSYPSLKSLGSWAHDLELRLDFINIWLQYGPPKSFWLSGFYFTQGFLTGTLQTHARKYDVPIDQLKYDFSVQKVFIDQNDLKKSHDQQDFECKSLFDKIITPKDGLIIHGLFLDAGKWDKRNGILIDPEAGEINPPLPAVHFLPVTKYPDKDTRYVCPLYKTSVRAGVLSTTGHSTNFVLALFLPSTELQSYWILRGTALLTQLTD